MSSESEQLLIVNYKEQGDQSAPDVDKGGPESTANSDDGDFSSRGDARPSIAISSRFEDTLLDAVQTEDQGWHRDRLEDVYPLIPAEVDSEDDGSDGHHQLEKERRYLGVNLHILPAKLFYLTFFGGLGCVLPYLPVYYRFVGLSARQTGIVQAVRPFVLFIATPLWGIIGDKFRRTKIIWMGSLFSLVVLTSLIAVVQPSTERLELRQICSCNYSVTNSSSTEMLQTDKTVLSELGDGNYSSICVSVKNDTQDVGLDKFLPLVALAVSGEFFGSPSPALADHFVLDLLGDERRSDYGKQRLWGAVGWGLGAFTAGYASNGNSECNANYSIHFILFVVIFVLCVAFALLIKTPTKSTKSTKSKVAVDSGVRIFQSLKTVLMKPKLGVFLITIWLIANLMAVIDNFLFWFLEDIGGGDLIIGLSLLFTCVGEIPVFFISGYIIGRIGHVGALYLTFLCYALRFFLYSILTNPWTILPVELLHGITFALMWATSTSYARANAPDGMKASLQAIMSGIYWGLGKGCGGILSGLSWQYLGARQTFRACAGVSLGGCLLFFTAQRLLQWKRCGGRETRQTTISASESYVMRTATSQENKQDNDLSTITSEL